MSFLHCISIFSLLQLVVAINSHLLSPVNEDEDDSFAHDESQLVHHPEDELPSVLHGSGPKPKSIEQAVDGLQLFSTSNKVETTKHLENRIDRK